MNRREISWLTSKECVRTHECLLREQISRMLRIASIEIGDEFIRLCTHSI